MTESYTAAVDAALSAEVYREVVFVKIEFPGYTFLATNLLRDYTIGSDVYLGCGPIGSISAISESSDVTADPIQLSLTGLDTSVAASLRDFDHQGSPVTIMIGLFDEDEVLIPDPVTIFVGVVDTMSLSMGESLAISVQADSYLRLLFRGPDGHRRMQADQDLIFPGDVGLEFAARLADTIPWGVPTKVEASAPTFSSGRLGPDIRSKLGR